MSNSLICMQLDHYTCYTLQDFLTMLQEGNTLAIAPETGDYLRLSAEAFDRLKQKNMPIYGTTTGFGPLVEFSSEDNGLALLRHLQVGTGDFAPAAVVKLTQLLRLRTLLLGKSGVQPELAERLLFFLQSEAVPLVPVIGSLGASGDLIPLAYCAAALIGEEVQIRTAEGGEISASLWWESQGWGRIGVSGREALALTNGTSFSTAYAMLAAADLQSLTAYHLRLTGYLYRLYRARKEAIAAPLHLAKRHKGSIAAAEKLRYWAGDYQEDEERPLQEIYTFRCAPQIFGAVLDITDDACRHIENEANAADDNPLFLSEEEMTLHGGNFYGQHIAFAADTIGMAATKLALLAERQIDFLTNKNTNQATPLLAYSPGKDSGIAGVQLTATALAAEIRSQAQQFSVSSISTNGGNQDIVSMSALAARQAFAKVRLLSKLLAALEIAVLRLSYLRESGIAAGVPLHATGEIEPLTPADADMPYTYELEKRAGRLTKFST